MALSLLAGWLLHSDDELVLCRADQLRDVTFPAVSGIPLGHGNRSCRRRCGHARSHDLREGARGPRARHRPGRRGDSPARAGVRTVRGAKQRGCDHGRRHAGRREGRGQDRHHRSGDLAAAGDGDDRRAGDASAHRPGWCRVGADEHDTAGRDARPGHTAAAADQGRPGTGGAAADCSRDHAGRLRHAHRYQLEPADRGDSLR